MPLAGSKKQVKYIRGLLFVKVILGTLGTCLTIDLN